MVRTPDVVIANVIFDLGGVLIDWDPRHLYRKLIADEAAVEDLLARVCTPRWNEQQDAGRPFADAVAELSAAHPDRADLIAAFYDRWDEMLGGAIEGTVAILEELDRRSVPLYALTNWSAETFGHARARFEFLRRFRGIVVSGQERLVKPDPRIFRLLLERHDLEAEASVFIDDVARNVDGACAVGLHGLRFTTAEQLRADLADLGLLGAP